MANVPKKIPKMLWTICFSHLLHRRFIMSKIISMGVDDTSAENAFNKRRRSDVQEGQSEIDENSIKQEDVLQEVKFEEIQEREQREALLIVTVGEKVQLLEKKMHGEMEKMRREMNSLREEMRGGPPREGEREEEMHGTSEAEQQLREEVEVLQASDQLLREEVETLKEKLAASEAEIKKLKPQARIFINEDLKVAAKEWCSDEQTAETKYGHISRWDVSGVTSMNSLFSAYSLDVGEAAKQFNADLSRWDVSNATDMGFTFLGAESFNCDLSSWNVEKVTTMNRMFVRAKKFNKNTIKGWELKGKDTSQHVWRGGRLEIRKRNYKTLIKFHKSSKKLFFPFLPPPSLTSPPQPPPS